MQAATIEATKISVTTLRIVVATIFEEKQSQLSTVSREFQLLLAIMDVISAIHEEIAVSEVITIIKLKIQLFPQLVFAVPIDLSVAEKTAAKSIKNAKIS